MKLGSNQILINIHKSIIFIRLSIFIRTATFWFVNYSYLNKKIIQLLFPQTFTQFFNVALEFLLVFILATVSQQLHEPHTMPYRALIGLVIL